MTKINSFFRSKCGFDTGIFFAFLTVVLSMALLCPLLSAQSYRGLIRGTVRDAAGAVLPGVTVTAKNIGTSLERTAVSADDGAFVLPELPAGEYQLIATANALQPVTRKVLVEVGADTTADISFGKLATVSQELTVTDAVPVVDTTRDVLGGVVGSKLVTELPLNGRDFGKLVALVPGVAVEGSGVAGSEKGFGQFNINGNRDRSNNYTLDGTDNNDPFFNNSALNQVGITGAPASLLPIDAIQEFNLQSSFGAEYGRNSGSVVNIITRSGSNQLHGTLFEFLRNNWFDARNFFNKRFHDDGTHNPQSPFKNNQFGGSLGAPIIKDRTFFFAAYEGQRERVGSDFTFFVPTADQKAAARAVALGTGAITAINPALDAILNFFPTPTGFNGIAGTVDATVKDKNDLDSVIFKVDHQLTSIHSLSGRYAFGRSQQTFPLGGLGTLSASRLPQFAQTSPTRVQVISLSLLSSLSSSKLNEVRFGYSRYRTAFTSLDASFDPSTLGPGFNLGTGKLGLPEFDFASIFDNLGATAFSVPRARTSQSYQILDNFTWQRGRHSIKFGGEYRHALVDSFNDNLERGGFVFGPTGLNADPAIDTLANFYLGNPFFVLADTGNTQRTTLNNGAALFVQDDFRFSSTFTVNLGLRWEYFGPISESHNLLSNLAPDGTLALVGTHGLNGAYDRNFTNFAPRVGFAWTAFPNTVLRAGYGLYYDYIPQDLLIANFTNSAGLVTNPVGPKPVFPLTFNGGAFNGSAPGPVLTPSSPPFDIFFTPRKLSTPYVQSWNFNVQQQFAPNIALEVGYVGSKGTKLVRLRDANQPNVAGVRPNPNFGFMDEFASISGSTYHAFQTTFRVQSRHGLSGFTSYTWSKSLDDASDGIDFNGASAALPQDSNNLRAEHGPSTFDTRHRYTAAFSYSLPQLQLLPKLLGAGWEFNTIASAQSGRPIPIVTSNDSSGTGFPTPSNSHQRPNLVPGVNPVLSPFNPANGYLNPAAFLQPPPGTFGTMGRNSIYGPHFWDIDISLAKNFALNERLNLQFRSEFFNIFNHPNFALPSGGITPGLPKLGIISQTPDVAQGNPGLGGGGPRVLQFGLKLTF